MKITAQYDSIDMAELSASAIRKNIGDSACLKISSSLNNNNTSRTAFVYSNFNTINTTPTFTIPVYGFSSANTIGITSDYSNDISGKHDGATIEVICKKDDSKLVNQYIMSYGGTNICQI